MREDCLKASAVAFKTSSPTNLARAEFAEKHVDWGAQHRLDDPDASGNDYEHARSRIAFAKN